MNSTRSAAYSVTAGYALFLLFTAGVANAADDFHVSIRGTVANAVTGEILRKAYVRLAPASDAANIRSTVTDEEGRFIFKDVRPGSYLLEAEHQGFIDGKYGNAANAPLELKIIGDQNLSGLNIKLMPPAEVSGRVIDEGGDLWTHAAVNVFRSKWARGKRQVEGFTSAEVDDKGEFRVVHLPPGRYYLSAEPDRRWEASNRATFAAQLQPTWYPSSPDLSAATAIVLIPGQEFKGAEIRMRLSSVYRVTGKVSGVQQLPVLPGPRLWMKPRLSMSPAQGMEGNSKSAFMKDDGSFEVAGVAPGNYQITLTRDSFHC